MSRNNCAYCDSGYTACPGHPELDRPMTDTTNALRALRNIVNVLGPSVPSSVTDEGARYEWDRALRYAREGVAAAQVLTQQRDDAERRAATLSRMLEERTFPAAIEVTELMVERGLRWYWPHDKEYADNQRGFMRRFLCAALATAQPESKPNLSQPFVSPHHDPETKPGLRQAQGGGEGADG